MQYHLNGFQAGNPKISPDEKSARTVAKDKVDVLIVGSGPAGLTLAAQLTAFPTINTRIVESKAGPLQMGQADGIACRSVEMFQAFGFAEKVMQEAYWVSETSFWRPDSTGKITRQNRIQDVEDGLSEFPHLILSQARIHDFYLEIMRNSPAKLEVDYNQALRTLELNPSDDQYPIVATLDKPTQPGETESVKAAYVVGCDGARSTVRQSLQLELRGDSANKAWGCAIQSAQEGSILIIPREGGYMVRLYIEFDHLHSNERVSNRGITKDDIVKKAQRIFAPYTLEVHDVVWWSVYEIGQRVCDAFDDVPATQRHRKHPRVFVAGDACHTHIILTMPNDTLKPRS